MSGEPQKNFYLSSDPVKDAAVGKLASVLSELEDEAVFNKAELKAQNGSMENFV